MDVFSDLDLIAMLEGFYGYGTIRYFGVTNIISTYPELWLTNFLALSPFLT